MRLPQPRRPGGTSQGGQFAAFSSAEQEGSLSDGIPTQPASPEEGDLLLACASKPSPADLGRCLHHRQPVEVRLAAVSNPAHPELTAYAAAGDPDPLIRAHALLSPYLDEDTRSGLMHDAEAMRAASELSGAPS